MDAYSKPPLRVLHVVRQYPPSVGGLEEYVRQLVEKQSGSSHVTVLTLDRCSDVAQIEEVSESIAALSCACVTSVSAAFYSIFIAEVFAQIRSHSSTLSGSIHRSHQFLSKAWRTTADCYVSRPVFSHAQVRQGQGFLLQDNFAGDAVAGEEDFCSQPKRSEQA